MATSDITPASVTKPLSDFQKISQNTFLYTSPTYSPKAPLILIFSWMGAAPKHIAKYTVAYQRLFPSARIVLIRFEFNDMFRRSEALQKTLASGLQVAREHVKNGGDVLMHSFSNGGAIMIIEFARLWNATTGEKLPLRAQIIDSAPGKGRWKRSHAAMYLSLPQNFFARIFGSLLIHLFLMSYYTWDKVTGKENEIVIVRRHLNSPALFDVTAPRVYLYSKTDIMVGDDEVEEHADQAEANGWHVTKVRFEKSPHAGHIREDEKKYWGAVMEAWNRGSK